MDSNNNLVLSEVENIYQQVDKLIEHLKNQTQLSYKDIEFLRQVIFHVDGLLNKMNSSEETQEFDIVKNDLIKYLDEANQHLRKVLLKHDGTQVEHTDDNQEKNDKFFVELISQLKKI